MSGSRAPLVYLGGRPAAESIGNQGALHHTNMASSLPACAATACSNHGQCGYCLRLLPAEECPSVEEVRAGLPPCEAGRVEPGQKCEADGACGTLESLDNCNFAFQLASGHLAGSVALDYYERVPCSFPLPTDSRPDAESGAPSWLWTLLALLAAGVLFWFWRHLSRDGPRQAVK